MLRAIERNQLFEYCELQEQSKDTRNIAKDVWDILPPALTYEQIERALMEYNN